jgi:hypothetical protein
VDELEEVAFHDRRDYYTLTKTAIIDSLEPDMKGWFYTTESNLVIGYLKNHFGPQVRLMVYNCLNEFYSLKMEEHTSVGIHLAKMHGIHRRLILEFDHEIPDPLANGAVLHSLPPSYRRFVIGFVMGGELGIIAPSSTTTLRSATLASSSTHVWGCNPHVRSSRVCCRTPVYRCSITNI